MNKVRQGFVYVLHFDTKLEHAGHYIGSTENLLRRLTAHANGCGARIMREMMLRGNKWRLGALGVASHASIRRVEREVKDQRHAIRYCGVCNALPKRIKGTKPYPIEMIDFPHTFDELCNSPLAYSKQVRVVRSTEVMEDMGKYMSEILSLMQRERDCLGFIPAGGEQGLSLLWESGKILLGFLGTRFVGYLVFTVETFGTQANIMQICVRDEARGYGVGGAMLKAVKNTGDYMALTAKVRVDLDANEFWMHHGFLLQGSKTHKTSGGILNHYKLFIVKEVGEDGV